ncbi:MAG: hypothetical protein IKA68_07425 [Clostridia bacterium]|nr:hypothetical protein [Clostridia bacterium]
MGKMKISNNKKRNNGGMPSWLLSLIVGLVAIIVVGTCLASFVGSTGVIGRFSTAMETENYSVNQPMMNYFYQTAYSSFVSGTYYQTLGSYCSLNNATYGNSGLSLDKQVIGKGTYDSILVPEEYKDKTWHDYFMDQAIATVEQVLVFCEVANERGIELTEEELENVKLGAEALAEQIRVSKDAYGSTPYAGLSDNACISAAFGDGVKMSDVRKALELTSLAGKAQNDISEELLDKVTLDRINAEYAENPKHYDLVDFLTYGFSVKYDTVSKDVLAEIGEDAKEADHKDEILAAYKEEIAKAIEKAKALSAITDKDEFLKFVLNDKLDEIYDDTYEELKEKAKLEVKVIPSEENVKAIKEAMVAKIFEELFAEEVKDTAVDDVEEKDDKFYAYEIEINKIYGEFLTDLKASLYSDLLSTKESCLSEQSTYTVPEKPEDEKENQKWLFADDRKEGDITLIEDGDGAKGAEVAVTDKHYTADVYLMVKPRYRDEVKVRDGAYMVFTKEDDAKAVIAELKASGSVTLESFLALAEEKAGGHSELKDYVEGSMGSADFDAWFLDEARVKGEYTAEPIKASTSSFIVAYFEQVGEITGWQADVKYTLYNQDFEKASEEYTEKYSSTIERKDSVLNKIGK